MSTSRECGGCGSSLADRLQYRVRNECLAESVETTNCPHCGSEKCLMCDAGDAVECGNCHADDEETADA